MFKLVQLIALAAAKTSTKTATPETAAEKIANKDADIAKANLKLQYNSVSKDMITGDSKISLSNFDVPATPAYGLMSFEALPNYQDIVDNQYKYCFQCLFSGGKWTARKEYKDSKGVTKIDDAKCVFSDYQEIDKLKTVTVDGDLSYKQLFDGLAVCGYGS
jgi:hypothetical protein